MIPNFQKHELTNLGWILMNIPFLLKYFEEEKKPSHYPDGYIDK